MRRYAVRLVVTLALSLLVWTGTSRAGTGSGPPLVYPAGIAVEASGTLAVVEPQAVVRVDPVSGDRSIVSTLVSRSRHFTAIAVEASGALVVVSVCYGTPTYHGLCGLWGFLFYQAVVRVDPASGQRTLVSGGLLGALRGSGPPFERPAGIAVEANGALVVADYTLKGIIRVDPVTGDRSIVADGATGSGPPLESPIAIAVEASGALVVDSILQAVVRVDPVSGGRTVLSQ